MSNYKAGEEVVIHFYNGRERATVMEVVDPGDGGPIFYKVSHPSYAPGEGIHVFDEDLSKVPPLQQLAEQALGNKTDNLSGKE